jgi:hypothetical protein
VRRCASPTASPRSRPVNALTFPRCPDVRLQAAAVNTPAVGIYWCFNLVNSSQVLRARHRPFVSRQLACPVCGVENIDTRCSHEVSFVGPAR